MYNKDMSINSKDFLKGKLSELHKMFPKLTIKYQYDSYTKNHMVEVLPLEEFESNDEYMKFESDISYEFDNKFFPESVMFVSEDSLSQVDEPELTFNSIVEKSFISDVSYSDHSFKINTPNLVNKSYNCPSIAIAA